MVNDIEQLKRQTNIVDLIGKTVELKKKGDNYWACCPFHGEKTPSFSVSEDKQFYYCFGCGERGDVLDWLMNYHKMDFVDAVKYLGGEIDDTPLKKIAENENRALHRFRLPPDHRQDNEQALICQNQCELIDGLFVNPFGHKYAPIKTINDELVNVYSIDEDELLAGTSYNGAHWIVKNKGSKWLAVTNYHVGNTIASIYGLNVAVCFTVSILKYMVKWNSGDRVLKPVICDGEDDYLCYEMPWLYWDGEKLIKKQVID